MATFLDPLWGSKKVPPEVSRALVPATALPPVDAAWYRADNPPLANRPVTTKVDEIIDEVRGYREAHAASLDYDLKRITQDFQRQERESGRELVTRPPRKPSAVRTPSAI